MNLSPFVFCKANNRSEKTNYNTPGGIGLAHKAYGMRDLLLEKALQVAEDCPCEYGCPSCVGPVGEVGEDGKRTAVRLLRELTK